MILAPRYIPRLASTVGLLTRYGLMDFAKGNGLLGIQGAQLEDGAQPEADTPTDAKARAFRERLVELGPAYIKLGQVLSTRPDLLPPSYVKELEHLQSREQGQDLMGNRPDMLQHREEKTTRGSNPVELKQEEARKFAREIAKRLDQDRTQKAFGSLVLVAGPKFLGLLREELSNPVKQLVTGEIDKDYTELRGEKVAELVPTF